MRAEERQSDEKTGLVLAGCDVWWRAMDLSDEVEARLASFAERKEPGGARIYVRGIIGIISAAFR
jgi:hypothetical protein